jgi:hypothetical protein
MQADNELETWQRQWQAQGSVPRDLRQRVERDIARRRLAFIGSVGVTVLIGGGTTLWAIASDGPDAVLLLVGVWMFIAITWGTEVQLDRSRGALRPMTETTAAFLDFAILNCRTQRRGTVASVALYAGFFVFMLAWKYRHLAAEMPLSVWAYLTSGRVITLGAITVALAVLALYRLRRLDRELDRLVILRSELTHLPEIQASEDARPANLL